MRRATVGAGVIVAALVAALWWRARPGAPQDAAGTRAARVAIAAPRAPELPGPPGGIDRALPAAASPVDRTVMQGRIADAHAHLQDAARPCGALVTNRSRDAEIRFGYRLAISAGEASVSEVSLVWSDDKSAALETCVLDKLATARWSSPDADWSTTVEDALVATELDDQ